VRVCRWGHCGWTDVTPLQQRPLWRLLCTICSNSHGNWGARRHAIARQLVRTSGTGQKSMHNRVAWSPKPWGQFWAGHKSSGSPSERLTSLQPSFLAHSWARHALKRNSTHDMKSLLHAVHVHVHAAAALAEAEHC
jgi:hypothetical protein